MPEIQLRGPLILMELRGKTDTAAIHFIGLAGSLSVHPCSKFRELVQNGAIPNGFHDGFFLAADKSSVDSYLNPGVNQSGFIVAVDNNFDREDTSGYRMDETPGYDGQVRVLGSLLWDDVSAQISRQSQYLEDIWPLAMQQDLQVYEGPWINEKLKPSQ